MPTATLTSKGQITLPIEVRRKLDLDTGSKVDFVWRDGAYVLMPSAHPVSRLAGFFVPYTGEPVSVEEMNETIAQAMSETP